MQVSCLTSEELLLRAQLAASSVLVSGGKSHLTSLHRVKEIW